MFNELFLLILIYFVIKQKNNILFLFRITAIILIVFINFYFNYRIGLVSLLTRFIFIGRLLVFFIYSILLFYNNFSYEKYNNLSIIFFFIRFILYKYNYKYIIFKNCIVGSILLDFSNILLFLVITISFVYLIFLCFSISKEKYI